MVRANKSAVAAHCSRDDLPDWSGETVVIIAGGQSASAVDLEPARSKAKIIVINESWRLCPWADLLYACDGEWWKYHKGVPDFTGLKLSQDAEDCRLYGLLKI